MVAVFSECCCSFVGGTPLQLFKHVYQTVTPFDISLINGIYYYKESVVKIISPISISFRDNLGVVRVYESKTFSYSESNISDRQSTVIPTAYESATVFDNGVPVYDFVSDINLSPYFVNGEQLYLFLGSPNFYVTKTGKIYDSNFTLYGDFNA